MTWSARAARDRAFQWDAFRHAMCDLPGTERVNVARATWRLAGPGARRSTATRFEKLAQQGGALPGKHATAGDDPMVETRVVEQPVE